MNWLSTRVKELLRPVSGPLEVELGDVRWLRIAAGALGAAMFLCAATVYVVDPYRRYHAKPIVQPLYEDDYRMIPGLLETADYDSLVAGTSLCLNFNLADFRQILKWEKPLKIAARGCYLGTFKLFCDRAFANRAVKHLSTSLDVFKLHDPPTKHFIPLEPFLYTHSALHECAYLFNADVVFGATTAIIKAHIEGDRRLDPDHMFESDDESGKTKYGKATIIKQIQRGGNAAGLLPLNRLTKTLKGMTPEQADRQVRETLESCVLSTIRAHPETEFIFFFPPYASWYWGYTAKNGVTDDLLRAKAYAIRELLALPNVRVYDFQTETEVATNLNNYSDLVHYSPAINKRIVEWIAADKGRCTAEGVAANAEAVRQIARQAAAEIP